MLQEEHLDKAEKVVDRVRLKEQLRQFHIDQDTMRNKGVEYSPRFRRNDDLRITGSGDHRSQSPTNPLNSRVSGKEKRRRVHAWLGAQVETGNDYNHGDACDTEHRTKPVGGCNHPSFTSSHKIDLGAGDLARRDPYLLHSNSEFVTDYDLPFTTKPREHSPQTNIQHGSLPYASKYSVPSRDYIPLIGEPKLSVNDDADISGGGNKYCYVYDPVIARAYTKKYNVEPTDNISGKTLHRDPLLQDDTVVKYLPASKNFTPSPTLTKAGCVNPTKDLPFTGCETDYPLPTKYEEYDMRPIKPLDAGLKKSLYGENHTNDKEDCPPPKPYPRPYLRRSHTLGVTYPTPKPARGRSSTLKLPSKIQSNIADTKEDPDKVQQSSSETSNITGQIRRNPTDALPEIPTDQTLANAQGSKACNIQAKVSPEIRDLPADLKHVQAATKIQAVWKGYKTRKLDPKVVEIRQEVRARRAEQYISVLCHEVQCLKENLDAEKKMRDLQTEAIRYIWSQLRMLQKRRSGDKVDGSGKKKITDRRSRSKSISPRRSVKKTNPKTASPLPMTSSVTDTQKSSQQYSESSALDYDDESDSLNSGDEKKTIQKPADASWKESPDEELFRNRVDHVDVKEGHPIQQDSVQAADDTDEGRGTLVTDGEGNPAHSSAEEEVAHKKDSSHITKESAKMRTTIDTLQAQVLQLQEAMFALTDKMGDHNKVATNLNSSDDDLKFMLDCPDASVVCPEQKLDEIERMESARLAPEPVLSARGDVPKISLKNALVMLKSALCENELWAICEQAGHNIKRKPFKSYTALENAFLRKDGRVEFQDIENRGIDDMYLAPEVLDKSSVGTVKSAVFSLSVVLWSAADWEMGADEAPQLTDELESLLVDMSQDDPEKRADIDEVIQICEDHHAKTRVNSLCVCSSLFAEVENAMILAKSGKANQKKIAQEISQDLKMKTKTMFRESVVPHINSCEWRSKLKPASERVLSPTPPKIQTPHEKLMGSLTASRATLKKSPRPKVFSVRDMFVSDPELVHKLNILPGQRRKNQKAMRLVMRRQSPKDPSSAPKPGVPTPPRALRAGVSEVANASGHSSVILRWHTSKMFDKQGQEANNEKLIGYRIYVNGHPKGMVAGTKSRALLEGLRHSTEYRVHVRAVSALGESDPSNTVIAHITSSPILRELKPECNNGDGERMHSKSDKKEVEKPVLSLRKPPQPKPRLGAVFPSQQIIEIRPSPGSKENSADSHAQESSDDVIDRVLRKYGIQQTTAIVPGFASGSTLSPMPLRCSPKLSTGTSTTASGPSTTAEENQTLGISISSKSELTTSSGHSEATSKSLELLTQLKTELLS